MQPNFFDQLIKWIGYAASIIGAFAALLVAIGKFGDAANGLCGPFPSLVWCKSIAPPKLAVYNSPEVDGPGHTQAEFCEPVAVKYRAENPDFNISWTASEGERKDIMGKVHRTYHCEFAATPKPQATTVSGLWFVVAAFAVALLAFLIYRRRRLTA